MIDILTQLASGFVHCLTPLNMAMLVVGIVIGLLIGVLPGLTLVMGVALALPFTYKMDVTASIVLLTAMYVSGTYGGAFTAILFRIPGEPIDVPMLWDGYTMGRKGKPAKALGWTLVAALGGGLLSAVVMVALTQPLAKFALRFSSPEYFVIVMFGLLGSNRMPALTFIFLLFTILTSVTGLMFPFEKLLPSHILSVLSLVLLAASRCMEQGSPARRGGFTWSRRWPRFISMYSCW